LKQKRRTEQNTLFHNWLRTMRFFNFYQNIILQSRIELTITSSDS